MTRILKSRYKVFKKTGIRFNARRSKLKLTLNKLNLRLWDNLEFKKNHKRSRHPKFNDTLWKLNFKKKQEIKAFYGGISELAYQKLNKARSNRPRPIDGTSKRLALTQSNLLNQLEPSASHRTSVRVLERSASLRAPARMMLSLFETRLDVVIFKLNWAMSIYHAKQLINHGHIRVNGKKIKTPSYILRPNDLIQVSSNPQSRKLIKKIVIRKLARINSIIDIIYFKRIPYFLGGIANLKNKFEYWLILPLSLEVDYLTMSATLLHNNTSAPILFPFAKA